MSTAQQESAPPQAVDPAKAQAAQIPLQAFTLPEFPPAASGLTSLILTSDIKLDEYFKHLEEDFATIPKLPQAINSLTLELFSLGYPPGFLNALSQQLPSLKTLVIYSQLFAGVTEESRKDAERFFENETELRALHLLDVFARPPFFKNAGNTLSSRKDGLKFLEVNYSFRHEDEDFLNTVPALELPCLIGPSLVTCALNISPPDVTNDPNDPANLNKEGEESQRKHEGVMALNKSLAPDLVGALTEEKAPTSLLLLNTTLYTFAIKHLEQVVEKHTRLRILSATIELEPTEEHKDKILSALSKCKDLEQVEIVGNPSLAFYMAVSNPRNSALKKAFPSQSDMTSLGTSCSQLKSFRVNILRTETLGSVEWNRDSPSAEWKGGVKEAQQDIPAPENMPSGGSKEKAPETVDELLSRLNGDGGAAGSGS
ncbi:MAG: hypothetical protein M1827_007275 [Pycnora praestabilis]|nr:MAG: hypothetical protein M1827_007275 [Pycnora praestabilis]